jgi:hypothetical protein
MRHCHAGTTPFCPLCNSVIDAVMTFPFVIASLLAPQSQLRDPALAARIPQLLHTVLATDDDKQKEAADAEAKQIFLRRGLPTIADVGDEAAYELVVLTCSPGPADSQAKILLQAKQALSRIVLVVASESGELGQRVHDQDASVSCRGFSDGEISRRDRLSGDTTRVPSGCLA